MRVEGLKILPGLSRLVALGELCREHAVRLLHFGVRWDAGDERVPARVADANPVS